MKKRFISNEFLSGLLRAVACAYQIKDDKKNKFKIIAYQRAADAIEHLSSEAKDLWDEGKLEEVSGIGPSIANHLAEIFKKGKSAHFEKIMEGINPSTFELLKIPGVGAKTAYKLANFFDLKNPKNAISQLEEKLKMREYGGLQGFGDESAQKILKGIASLKKKKKRLLLPVAEGISQKVVDWLKKEKEIKDIEVLGSLRRKASTIGDIDIGVSTENFQKTINHFVNYPDKVRILEKGKKDASIILINNIQVDLKVSKPENFGSLLQHFTGSKHHNIALRELALKKGMSLSEYGIKKDGQIIACDNEIKFYNLLGLEYIPPELREDEGEIEAAQNGKIPKNLVDLCDIKGDFQIHSNFDVETSHDLGISSMEEIIKKAEELNYEYLAFSEHNPSQRHHKEKDFIEILKRKKEKIDQINYSISKHSEKRIKKVFNSLEIDILPSGSLPLPEKAFDLLDFALVSVHSSFSMEKKKMTDRILKALSFHKKVKIFAHPTARRINYREGIEADWEKIFDYCLKNHKYLEINGDPLRLDLPDYLVKEAVKKGVKFVLGTDAHFKEGLLNMKYAVFVARRGWAQKGDILNTLGYNEVIKYLTN